MGAENPTPAEMTPGEERDGVLGASAHEREGLLLKRLGKTRIARTAVVTGALALATVSSALAGPKKGGTEVSQGAGATEVSQAAHQRVGPEELQKLRESGVGELVDPETGFRYEMVNSQLAISVENTVEGGMAQTAKAVESVLGSHFEDEAKVDRASETSRADIVGVRNDYVRVSFSAGPKREVPLFNGGGKILVEAGETSLVLRPNEDGFAEHNGGLVYVGSSESAKVVEPGVVSLKVNTSKKSSAVKGIDVGMLDPMARVRVKEKNRESYELVIRLQLEEPVTKDTVFWVWTDETGAYLEGSKAIEFDEFEPLAEYDKNGDIIEQKRKFPTGKQRVSRGIPVTVLKDTDFVDVPVTFYEERENEGHGKKVPEEVTFGVATGGKRGKKVVGQFTVEIKDKKDNKMPTREQAEIPGELAMDELQELLEYDLKVLRRGGEKRNFTKYSYTEQFGNTANEVNGRLEVEFSMNNIDLHAPGFAIRIIEGVDGNEKEVNRFSIPVLEEDGTSSASRTYFTRTVLNKVKELRDFHDLDG